MVQFDEKNGEFVLRGNLLVQSDANDFLKGIFEDAEIGQRGMIEITKSKDGYGKRGVYMSAPIIASPFNRMILSWNTVTPEGTYVEVEGQVLVDGLWSRWFSWGKWSTYEEVESASEGTEDSIAKIDTDTLIVTGNRDATALRYRIILHTNSSKVTPSLALVAASINSDKSPIKSDINYNIEANMDYFKMDVPNYSQLIRDPQIGGVICSATCVTMALGHFGIERLPEETAWGVWDNVYDGAGNWSFNCAYAGSFGLRSYVAYFNSIEDLKKELLMDHVIVASVRYKMSEEIEKPYPVLHNAPYPFTAGHLVLVRGFVKKDGEEYLIVNDPAAPNDEEVTREYLVSEFEKCWDHSQRVGYVISKGSGISSVPEHLRAELVDIGERIEVKGKSHIVYALRYKTGSIDLSRNNIRSIIVHKKDDKLSYIEPGEENRLLLPSNVRKNEYIFTIIARNHRVYEAVLK